MKTEPRDEMVQATPVSPLSAPGGAGGEAATRRPSAWAVLRHRDYALLFWGQLVSAAGTQVAVVVIAWQVFLLTHSALALGIIGLMQAIPRLIFSLVGGVFADVLDRRKMLLAVNILLAGISVALALTTISGAITVYVIYAAVLASATVSSFEFPTRQ